MLSGNVWSFFIPGMTADSFGTTWSRLGDRLPLHHWVAYQKGFYLHIEKLYGCLIFLPERPLVEIVANLVVRIEVCV